MKFYSVAFHQNNFDSKDPLAKCGNYPTALHQSYLQCDDDFVTEKFKEMGFPEPLWLKTKQKDKDEKHFNRYVENPILNLLNNLVAGVELSSCPKPCSSTNVISRLVQQAVSYDNSSWIDIVPSPNVVVTDTKFVRPVLTTLMSEFGGALGLWLGIGVLQLMSFVMKNANVLYLKTK